MGLAVSAGEVMEHLAAAGNPLKPRSRQQLVHTDVQNAHNTSHNQTLPAHQHKPTSGRHSDSQKLPRHRTIRPTRIVTHRGISGTPAPQTTQRCLTAPGHLQPDKGTHKCTDACRAQLRSPGPPTCDCAHSHTDTWTRGCTRRCTHCPQHNIDLGLQPPPHPVPVEAQTQRHTGSHMETDDKTHPTHTQGSARIHAQHTHSISVPPSPHADADALPIT